MAIPTTSWSEISPAGADAISTGDDRIREMKEQLREIFEVDHLLANGNQDYFGFHSKLTLLAQSPSPSSSVDNFILFAKDVSAHAELHFLTVAGAEVQLTSGGSFIGGFTNDIRMYKGALASIPTGWALCDGNGGRPNMVNLFVRGVVLSTTAPGTTVSGGSVTLTTANIPSHTHTATLDASGTHTHTNTISYATTAYYSNGYTSLRTFIRDATFDTIQTSTAGGHTHTLTDTSTFAGTAKTFSPPYYEVAFLIKT